MRVRRQQRVARRDWRHAAVGAGCLSLGSLCVLLVACSVESPRTELAPVAISPPSNAAPPQVAGDHTQAPAIEIAPAAQARSPSPWQRLRERFALPGCDYRPEVLRWARRYSQLPDRLGADLARSMPFLLLVVDALEQRDVPGEFALLPYLESSYTPFVSSGDRPAGVWQFEPDTARAASLRIDRDYDGRLDVYASTIAALDLLHGYRQEFGDWRLADMAFAAGEYRIKRLVGADPAMMSAHELAHLRLSAATHEHLAKLLALACIVSDPDRFRVTLPEARAEDVLALLEFDAPIDLRLAARMAGLSDARMRQLNPGYRRDAMTERGPLHLLIPQAHEQAFIALLAQIPASRWREWHIVTVKRPGAITLLAADSDLSTGALAAINGVDTTTMLATGTRLLLPGANTERTLDDPAGSAPDAPGTVIVHSGDTLWEIAQRCRLKLDDLLRWNGLTRNATLHLGQRLRLLAPEGLRE